MKKIPVLIMTLCLICIAATLAETKTTILQVEVAESYEIVIPATVSIPFEATRTNLPVEVTMLRAYSTGTIAGTVRKLYVKVSDNAGALINENGDKISYSIGGSEDASDKCLYFTNTGKKNFTIDITEAAWDAAPAGSYTNTITFNVAIANFSD